VNGSIIGFRRGIWQAAIITVILSGSARASRPIPADVRSAKTAYLVNETGNQKVLAVATDEFTDWGRFAFVKSKDDADLIVVFTHNWGMDKWGNLGITEMDVFVKGQKEPAFVTKNAVHVIDDRQHPTKNCVRNFRKRLEAKN
jgi:hypothetical protein